MNTNKKHSTRINLYNKSLSTIPNIEDKKYYIGLKNKRIKEVEPLEVRDNGVTFGFIKEQNRNLNKKITELQKELQLYKNGGIIILEDGNYIKELINIPENRFILTSNEVSSEITSDILEYTKTPLYSKIPFLKLEDGLIVIDKIQYNKYKGAIL